MRIKASIETLASILAGIFTSGAIMVMMLGCMQAQQQEPQWPPVVEFGHAGMKGTMELLTPAGPVTVDIDTGIASGEGELLVTKLDLEADVEFTVNGASQTVKVKSAGAPSSEGFAQCVEAWARSELVSGLGVDVHAVPPGLLSACGPAVLEVQTPLGNWSTPDPSPPPEE